MRCAADVCYFHQSRTPTACYNRIELNRNSECEQFNLWTLSALSPQRFITLIFDFIDVSEGTVRSLLLIEKVFTGENSN